MDQQQKQLRQRAHHLKPVVTIGQHGLTDAVQLEIDRALEHHELIKIKIQTDDREEKRAIVDTICNYQQAQCIQRIGKTATLYRQRIKG